MLVLHVTNGDHAAGGLARSGLPGDVVAWRDVLHDGPVLADNAAGFRVARAEFLVSRGWTDSIETVVEDLTQRDQRLAGLTRADAVVLWFEPDLYDQLQLLQVLDQLSNTSEADRPTVSVVPADCFLGPMKPSGFAPLYQARRPLTSADIDAGRDAWRAFTSPTPTALMSSVAQLDAREPARTFSSSDSARLPHLAAALRRQLEEFPDVEHGLSRSDRQLCEALAPGEMRLSKLFPAAHQASETWAWLSDLSFAWYVERLSDCACPLITHGNGTRVIASSKAGKGFWDRTVVLTPFGQEVVRARADFIALNGIDRWIGGVHLTTDHHWRWDSRSNALVERRAG